MMLVNGSSEGVALYKRGAVLEIKCVKGSAFNTQDLVSKKLTKGKDATDAERFGSLTMRCTDKDAWEPPLQGLAKCSGDVLNCAIERFCFVLP